MEGVFGLVEVLQPWTAEAGTWERTGCRAGDLAQAWTQSGLSSGPRTVSRAEAEGGDPVGALGGPCRRLHHTGLQVKHTVLFFDLLGPRRLLGAAANRFQLVPRVPGGTSVWRSPHAVLVPAAWTCGTTKAALHTRPQPPKPPPWTASHRGNRGNRGPPGFWESPRASPGSPTTPPCPRAGLPGSIALPGSGPEGGGGAAGCGRRTPPDCPWGPAEGRRSL